MACAFLVALKVTGSRAKDVTLPAKLPVSFFSLKSPVHDFFLGQLDQAETLRQDSEITLFFFYAPWCGQSVAVSEEIEKVANRLADQVLFVAINCWWNQGKCRKQKHFFYFPAIYVYHKSFGPIEYKGPMHDVYIEKFVRRVMSPLRYISSRSKLQQFLSHYEPGVLGYFEFNASPQPPGYLAFFTSALHSLNKDDLGTLRFGVITAQRVAKEISLTSPGSLFLHRHLNSSLFYPHEATKGTAESVWKWALENRETYFRWLRPHGGKSLLLHNELKKGPALFLFFPFDPLADHQPLVNEISRMALEYNRCNQSHGGQVEAEGVLGGDPSAAGPSLSLASSPCCNTVLLPLQWHTLSRTHNVCELCVNQTAGIRPSRLGGNPLQLLCSFRQMEAALDAFYLKGQTFFHLVPRAVSLCSNFLRFYSPFGHYTACCRTVDGGPRRSFASLPPGTPHPLEALIPSDSGKRREAPVPVPRVEAGGSVPCGSALTGLRCRTNKTLNLYLMDSNLFWRFAQRLGAAHARPRKEFAAIVDLKEETHYVSDQDRPLLRSSLETFIQKYSLLFSPLKRHLVGDTRPGPSGLEHRIRDVTTGTFRDIVLENGKDALLLYYAPWCGFCTSLNHIFIQLARILPPDHFVVARVDISQNDLPWEFMTDHLPNVLFFPRDRKDQSVAFPLGFPLTLPNLLRFAFRHASQLPTGTEEEGGSCGQEGSLRREAALRPGRLSHLEKEVERQRGQLQALHRAQSQLQGQLREARQEGQRMGQEARILRTQHGALQGLYGQRTREVEGLAQKLQELAEASQKLLAENDFLKVLLASLESKRRWARSEPASGLPEEEEEEADLMGGAAGNFHGTKKEEEEGQAATARASEPPSRESQIE